MGNETLAAFLQSVVIIFSIFFSGFLKRFVSLLKLTKKGGGNLHIGSSVLSFAVT